MNLTFHFQQKLYAAIRVLIGGGAPTTAHTAKQTQSARCAKSGSPRPLTGVPRRVATSTIRPRQNSAPLRVVRVFETGQGRASVGRMVISGRMADVCAELDRLVAHEAALH